MCSIEGCERPTHSRGLCQAHYRQIRRREDDPAVGTRKRGPKAQPRPAKIPRSHRAREPHERVRKFATETHCANNHEFTAENTYTNPRGRKVCKVCRMNAQRKLKGLPPLDRDSVGVWNRDKTDCANGHAFTPENTYFASGQRHCRRCAREQRIRRVYGLEPEQYDAILTAQSDACAICREALEDGRNLHVDHDHSTGAVRGLLCTKCNNGIGCFGDDIEVLKAAVRYLRRVNRSNQRSN